jgi:hypothetical protein
MVAVVGVDAQLVDHLEVVLAPVLDIDQGVIQWCTIVTEEGVALAQVPGGGEDVRGKDLIQQSGKFRIHQIDFVERFKFFPKIFLKRITVTDVLAICVFEIGQRVDQALFDLAFYCHEYALLMLLP